ncbi:ATP-binding cassette domain-containing protein [Nocardioides ginsengisoli]|uniref:ABC transporter ATP-binding protein n=1 Tax=Nocardioides ginsengisoli TaxID=363868 RepID=A0ABW3VVG0_9ACTN
MTALVEFAGLGRTFGSGPQAVVAIHDAMGAIEQDDRIALVGRSGSGKSTLLWLVAGLDTPTHGTISWPALGRPKGDPFLVGTVFQVPSLVPTLTAVENVALPLLLHGVAERDAFATADAALERIDLAAVARQLPDELSGGQAQRVAVARVLATRPRLLLADEPTGRIDRHAAREVLDALRATADEVGAGLVVASHDPLVYDTLPQRWTISDGRVAVTGALR